MYYFYSLANLITFQFWLKESVTKSFVILVVSSHFLPTNTITSIYLWGLVNSIIQSVPKSQITSAMMRNKSLLQDWLVCLRFFSFDFLLLFLLLLKILQDKNNSHHPRPNLSFLKSIHEMQECGFKKQHSDKYIDNNMFFQFQLHLLLLPLTD